MMRQSEEFHLRASYEMEEELVEAFGQLPYDSARALRDEQQLPGRRCKLRTFSMNRNIAPLAVRPILRQLGYRSFLAVPLLREEQIMGDLTICRTYSWQLSA